MDNKLSTYNDLAFLLTLTTKPPVLRWGFFGLFLYINYQRTFGVFDAQTDIFMRNATGCGCVLEVLRLLDAFCLSDMRLVGQTVPGYSLPLWSRIKWAVQLKLTTRGTGWQHEPKHAIAPPPVGISRTKFVLQNLLWILWGIFCLDLVGLTLSYGLPDGLSPFWRQSWRHFRYFLQLYTNTYFGMSTMYSIFSIFFVMTRFTVPGEWPPLFQHPSGAYTVQRFWG